jgi:PAS domain S-box-containing protein
MKFASLGQKPQTPPTPPAAAARQAESRAVAEDARLKELLQREMVLRESHARYRNLFDRTPTALLCIDGSARIRSVNRSAIQLLGYTAPELLDKQFFDLFIDGATGKNRARELFLWLQRMQDADTHEEELEVRTPDGRNLWINLAMRAARDANGQIIECAAVLTDITRAHVAEASLAEAEARFRRLFVDNASPMWRMTFNGQMVDCNEAFAQAAGCESRRAALQVNFWKFVDEQQHDSLTKELQASGKVHAYELHLQRPDKQQTDLLINAALHLDNGTQERFIEVTAMNITGRSNAAAQTAEAENVRYRSLLEGIARELSSLIAGTQPAAAPTAVNGKAPAVPDRRPANAKPTILLAEKDAAVRTVMRSILQNDGYTVLEAPTGSEAVAVSTQQQFPIDLLVAAVSMPDMTGHELARCVSHLHKRTKVVFLSDTRKDGCITSEGYVLGREFTPADLSRTVRSALRA